MVAYRAVNGTAPSYINTIPGYTPACPLISANEMRLKIPSSRGLRFQLTLFSFVVPGWWNNLPSSIRLAETTTTFKKQHVLLWPGVFEDERLAAFCLVLPAHRPGTPPRTTQHTDAALLHSVQPPVYVTAYYPIPPMTTRWSRSTRSTVMEAPTQARNQISVIMKMNMKMTFDVPLRHQGTRHSDGSLLHPAWLYIPPPDCEIQNARKKV
ncbi:uncharacterized protein LOC114772544 [Denticeps clupeoides]|uniref:uncharacterized protein LOC114772544 n=1 Tax=Denticeps clupeoides TaxID=299321 RepID=UPI0010A2D0F3|nr:uncharacterized protein LOC114772544 [Denticeps clupeoides]